MACSCKNKGTATAVPTRNITKRPSSIPTSVRRGGAVTRRVVRRVIK